MAEPLAVLLHSVAQSLRASHVAGPERRFGDRREQAVRRPGEISRSVGDGQSLLADLDGAVVIAHRQVIDGESRVNRDLRMEVDGSAARGASDAELPGFVEIRFGALEFAASHVKMRRPHQHSWKKIPLIESPGRGDRLLSEGQPAVPVTARESVLHGELVAMASEKRRLLRAVTGTAGWPS